MTWTSATILAARTETAKSRTLTLGVEGWSGHRAGQHVVLRLTAEDGYTAQRSYSIASSAASGLLEVTVDRLDDGEVSPYLVDTAEVGDRLEVYGPAGGWFVWNERADDAVQLIGGGSGIVPLMSMIRTHGDLGSTTPFRLLYAVRSPDLALFRDELMEREASDPALAVTWAYSRAVPVGWPHPPGRLARESALRAVLPAEEHPLVFVCGATPFVESVATWLVDDGHDPARVRTERYGG